MTRPCAFCGDPTERVYSVDMDLPGVPLCSYLCLHVVQRTGGAAAFETWHDELH